MHPIGFVYLTTNLVNCKRYIGQCKFSNRRWKTYLGSGKLLNKAFKKYGKENFEKEIICYAFTMDDLNYLETYFIAEYNAVTDPNFYNLAAGGYATRGFQGKKHSEEHKKMMSEKLKGHKVSRKVIDHMRDLGKTPKSNEMKELLREKTKAAWENGTHKRAKPVSIYGKTYPTKQTACKDLNVSRRKLDDLLKGFQPM